jgi:hypothetical protein
MSPQTLTFRTHLCGKISSKQIALTSAVIAGWTGRDPIARDRHIAELEALGVARPKSAPIYYRVSAARLTTSSQIEATGDNSSGEVELVLIRDTERLWLGIGSDHTDRKVETYCVTFSKQMCDKPLAPELWAFDEVRDHWDSLVLRSWIDEGGEQRLYQEGPASTMLAPDAIIAGFAPSGSLPEGTAMFCGTLAAKGGIRPSKRFLFELFDPLRDRRIMHGYDISVLPVEG